MISEKSPLAGMTWSSVATSQERRLWVSRKNNTGFKTGVFNIQKHIKVKKTLNLQVAFIQYKQLRYSRDIEATPGPFP